VRVLAAAQEARQKPAVHISS